MKLHHGRCLDCGGEILFYPVAEKQVHKDEGSCQSIVTGNGDFLPSQRGFKTNLKWRFS